MSDLIQVRHIDFKQEGTRLKHHWSKCIGAGRACEGLRAEWQNQLRTAVQECGFEYIRFHGLLSDDMFVYRETEGVAHYNWSYIDSLFDALLDIGIRPFVEFGFMPSDLASGTNTQFWWKGNVTPPKDYGKWRDLIYNLIMHWKERYGLEEIKQWYYEVWNEADLSAFWAGTKSEYFQLYKVTVGVIKDICSELKVGGPATSNFVPDSRFDGETEDMSKHITNKVEDLESLEWKGVWIEDFLAFCEQEQLPVDFISTHPYPTDFALDGQSNLSGRSRSKDSLKEDLTWLKRIVKASAYPKTEIQLTEWSSSPSSRDYSHDYLPAANYIVKSNLDTIGLTDSLSYWVFTDIFEEEGGGPEALHGGFGLMTIKGFKKPAYHAYRLLHKLGDRVLYQYEDGIITKTGEGKLTALFYNYDKELKQTVMISSYPDKEIAEHIFSQGQDKEILLKLEGLKANAEVILEILDGTHGVITTKWKELGYPKNLTREEEQVLFTEMEATSKKSVRVTEDGSLQLSITAPPWALVSVREQ